MPFNRVLESVARIARRDRLVLILSDFDEIDGQTQRLIAGMAMHNDVLLGLVADPIADDVPAGLRLVVSDGSLQAEIDTHDKVVHKKLADLARGRLAEILDWQRQIGVPVMPLSTAEDSVEQMRRLFGLGRRRA